MVLSQFWNVLSNVLLAPPGIRQGASPLLRAGVTKPGTPAFWALNQPHGSIPAPNGSSTSSRKNDQGPPPPHALNVTQPFECAITATGQ